jgi:hypothetical protein
MRLARDGQALTLFPKALTLREVSLVCGPYRKISQEMYTSRHQSDAKLHDAWARSPQTYMAEDKASRTQVRGIIAVVVSGIVGAGALIYTRYRIQHYREQNWDSAIATIEDVRPTLVGQINSNYGGRMLYSVEVSKNIPQTAPRKKDGSLLHICR